MATSEALTPKRAQRRYDAEFRAHALVLLKANNDNVFATAKQLDIPRLTLREWAKNGRGITPEVLAAQHTKETDMAKRYGEAASLYLTHATDPLTISATTGLDAMKSSAIATDKQQLLLGNPTSISGSVMSEDERRLRVADLLFRIAARAAAEAKPLQESPA
jgi:transposase-like protein